MFARVPHKSSLRYTAIPLTQLHKKPRDGMRVTVEYKAGAPKGRVRDYWTRERVFWSIRGKGEG